MKAGPRDKQIIIQRDTGTSENTFGERVQSWGTYATEWAQVVYGTGGERRAAGLEGAEQTATFRVLANALTLAVTPRDRVSFNGIWDVVGAVPLGRDGVEITAIKRA